MPEPTVISFMAGELRIRHWPAELRPPFGLTPDDDCVRGPARLHRAVRRVLRTAEVPFLDGAEPPPMPVLAPRQRAGPIATGMFGQWSVDATGIVCGVDTMNRSAIASLAAASTAAPTLVIAADSAIADMWWAWLNSEGLETGRFPCGSGYRVCVATAAAAARHIARVGDGHALLVVDLPELIPLQRLLAIVDGSAAEQRLGLCLEASPRRLMQWTQGLGPLVARRDPGAIPVEIELRVPLPPAARAAYDAGWHAFLCAYDRLGGAQGGGFEQFVQKARNDPEARPGLLGWHAALEAASWNEAKAVVVGELLQRHRGWRILVFTPDRRSAYELARRELITPVTSEMSRSERRAAIDAFVAGELRVLAGPRLLDAGVPDRCADVGILVGSGLGRAQRRARVRRVEDTGVVYELVGLDTVEVGRAARWRGTSAVATAADRCR